MINFLFLLCVSYAGADNCDYSWVVVDNLDSAGLYDPTTKTVYVSPTKITEVITHEVKHIQCRLMYKNNDFLDRTFCDFRAEMVYSVQSFNEVPPTRSSNAIMSGKMLDTLGLIGVVADFNGKLRY